MSGMEHVDASAATSRRRFTGLQVFGIVGLAVLVTALATAWIVKRYLFPSDFEPVMLSATEERQLEQKIERLRGVRSDPRSRGATAADSSAAAGETPLEPERYAEDPARREISFGERELNALIAHNTNLASRLAIDLSDNLASAKLLVPMDPAFPVLGGKTVRVDTGLEIAFDQGRPIVVLKGVSIMGVPVPNAWLGNLKNVDLVNQFGGDGGFWRTLAEGIEYVRVEDGQLHLKLRE